MRRITAPRRWACLAVWVRLLDFANHRQELRFTLDQGFIGEGCGMSRKTVGLCVSELADIGLLKHKATPKRSGRFGPTVFTICPTVAPVKAPPWVESSHGPPCNSDVTPQSYNSKQAHVVRPAKADTKRGVRGVRKAACANAPQSDPGEKEKEVSLPDALFGGIDQ
jgi:hypothetical protein